MRELSIEGTLPHHRPYHIERDVVTEPFPAGQEKCGGRTEALEMIHATRQNGLELLVGNMIGTSLAIAQSFLVRLFCEVVDLDRPLFLAADRSPWVRYTDGMIVCPPEVWGGAPSTRP